MSNPDSFFLFFIVFYKYLDQGMTFGTVFPQVAIKDSMSG